MPESVITQRDIAELIERMNEAAGAYIRGDSHRYLSLFDYSDAWTLMPPTGGETRREAYNEQRADEDRKFFTAGQSRLEVQQSYASGDIAVLVAVERQHGVVGGIPEQDWSLRVTLVFRRLGDRWQLEHRHADPLVHEIPFDHMARLARGLDT